MTSTVKTVTFKCYTTYDIIALFAGKRLSNCQTPLMATTLQSLCIIASREGEVSIPGKLHIKRSFEKTFNGEITHEI